MPSIRGLIFNNLAMGQSSTSAPADTTAPTVEITSAAAATVYEAFDITVTFSEPVTWVTGLTVGNGTASELVDGGDGTTWTSTITPTALGAVTVDVAEGAAQDAAGNDNEAATQFSRTFTVYAYDTFTDATGTAIAAHTPEVGGAWTVYSTGAEYDIQTNRLRYKTADLGQHVVGFDTGLSDVKISAVLTQQLNGDPGLAFRYINDDNMWAVRLRGATNDVQVFKRLEGTTTALTPTYGVTLTPGTDYAIVVRLSGASIKVWIDGALAFDLTDTDLQTATIHGIRGQDVGELFDTFIIQPPDGSFF